MKSLLCASTLFLQAITFSQIGYARDIQHNEGDRFPWEQERRNMEIPVQEGPMQEAPRENTLPKPSTPPSPIISEGSENRIPQHQMESFPVERPDSQSNQDWTTMNSNQIRPLIQPKPFIPDPLEKSGKMEEPQPSILSFNLMLNLLNKFKGN
jgi:hypothetical protein